MGGEAAKLGRYTLVERIGIGGMAEVWKARIDGPAGFRRTVVIKRILPLRSEDASFIDLFVREARLSSKLIHPNIVQVYELGEGETDGAYFMAMEYVRGKDLSAMLAALGARGALLPPALAALIARDLCRALAYAHDCVDSEGNQLKVVHRDVSPANVMINDEGGVKLLDFGIAKVLHSHEVKTITGTIRGKLPYLPPEAFTGAELGRGADLFAVGVVLHEMLCGQRLFKGTSDAHTIDLVRRCEVAPPSGTHPAIPAELDRIVLKALARDPAARYPSGEAFASDLDQVLVALSATPGDLSALMFDLFGDLRLAQSQTESSLATAETVQHDPDPSVEVSGRGRSRWLGIAAGSVVVALVGLGATLMFAAPRPAAEAPPALTVDVHIDSSPAGAEVFVDDETTARGRTPLSVQVPRGDRRHRARVHHLDHAPGEIQFVADQSQRVQIVLPAAPVAAPVVEPASLVKQQRSKTPAHRSKATPPVELTGQIADPFE